MDDTNVSCSIWALFWVLVLSGGACDRDKSKQGGSNTPNALTVVSYGAGAYQQAHRDAFCEPFGKAKGITVESVSWGAEYGKLRQMVASGKVPWDVVEVTAAQYSRGVADNLYEPIFPDERITAFEPLLNSPSVKKYGVPNIYWSTALCFNRSKIGTEHPQSWSDFWDVTKFPGRRALYDDPRGNLEFALLADGVKMNSLYPLDVERAFKKLDVIKPHIDVWWRDGTEPVQLLSTHRVVMSSGWTGRIFASKDARERLSFAWNGAAHELDFWVVPKGSKNLALAKDFITFASQPENMARVAVITAYGPTNANAHKLIPSDVQPYLPTTPENWDISFVIESTWWAEHEVELQKRWVEWKNR